MASQSWFDSVGFKLPYSFVIMQSPTPLPSPGTYIGSRSPPAQSKSYKDDHLATSPCLSLSLTHTHVTAP